MGDAHQIPQESKRSIFRPGSYTITIFVALTWDAPKKSDEGTQCRIISEREEDSLSIIHSCKVIVVITESLCQNEQQLYAHCCFPGRNAQSINLYATVRIQPSNSTRPLLLCHLPSNSTPMITHESQPSAHSNIPRLVVVTQQHCCHCQRCRPPNKECSHRGVESCRPKVSLHPDSRRPPR